MTEGKTTYLVAARGFSANGVTMNAGDYLTDQFDAQTVKLLKGMGRLVETETAPGDDEGIKTAKGKKTDTNRAVGLPGGLPGVPGAGE